MIHCLPRRLSVEDDLDGVHALGGSHGGCTAAT